LSLRIKKLAGVVAGGLAAAALSIASPTHASAAVVLTGCDPARPSTQAFYGPAASAIYDNVFHNAFATPNLSKGYIPQGMTTWALPNGSSLIIIGEYKPGNDSYLVAVDPSTGHTYGTVKLAEAHLGGIAVVGNWLFAQDKPGLNHEKVRKYDMGKLAKAFLKSHNTGTNPYVGKTGALQKVYWASFMSSYGGHLYAGHHGINDTNMIEYTVSKAGVLKQKTVYQAPQLTDGVVVTGDRFIFVSHNDTNNSFGTMTITKRSTHLSGSPIRCFAMPNLGEGAVLDHGVVYTVFESGSTGNHSTAADKIKNVHGASYTFLSQLLSN
jgi:hypothetical protein